MKRYASYTEKFSVRDIVLCGLIAAILLVLQITFAALPNIEVISLLIIVCSIVLGVKTIPIIYIFALLEGFIYGFGIWWFMYLYVWTILYVIVRIFRNNKSSVFWAVIGGFYGLAYGLLCSVPYLVAGGVGAGLTWWIRGIPYDLIHGVSNFFVILFLFKPVCSLLKKLYTA